MPRRTFSRNYIEIELFPFLSILACTIGTLILLIIVLTTQLLSNQREITIIAKTDTAGDNNRKIPKYIECREDGVILHPSQEFVAKSEINSRGSKLSKLIAKVRENRNKEYLIVVLRPEGIEVFQKVREMVEKQGIDLGYEPLEKGWKLTIEESKK
ncbi:MAG TPA: hypothetical protein DCF68_09025 [Cyanothece sp. UBA12306]|nr:hypothetical protein [Cyanothece sp. UBA12306]